MCHVYVYIVVSAQHGLEASTAEAAIIIEHYHNPKVMSRCKLDIIKKISSQLKFQKVKRSNFSYCVCEWFIKQVT